MRILSAIASHSVARGILIFKWGIKSYKQIMVLFLLAKVHKDTFKGIIPNDAKKTFSDMGRCASCAVWGG